MGLLTECLPSRHVSAPLRTVELPGSMFFAGAAARTLSTKLSFCPGLRNASSRGSTVTVLPSGARMAARYTAGPAPTLVAVRMKCVDMLRSPAAATKLAAWPARRAPAQSAGRRVMARMFWREVDVVGGGGVVDEAGVHGAQRSKGPAGRAADSSSMRVGGGHEGRLDGGGAPERGEAGDVRAGHGRAGEDVELGAPGVGGDPRGAHAVGPRRQDVEPRGHHVGLEHVRGLGVGPARRERRHHGGRAHAEPGPAEADGCGGGAGGGDVAAEGVAGGGAHGGGGEDVAVGDEALAVEGAVGEDHPGGPGAAHHLALRGARADAAVAHDDPAAHRGGVEGALEAEGRGVPVGGGGGVGERVEAAGGEAGAAAVDADAGEDAAVGEDDVGGEVAVHGAGADGGDPGGDVGDGELAGAAVAGGGGDEDPGLGGGEGAHGDGVEVVGHDDAADAEGDDVDPVAHGGVEGGEDVGVEATPVPAHLVGGEARLGGHPRRDPARVAEGGGREHAVCVPWPSVSRGERSSAEALMGPEKKRAPTSLRLQDPAGKPGPESQAPRQRAGAAERPRSEKLRREGEMPVSRTPMTRSDPKSESARMADGGDGSSPRNCGDRVVSGRRTSSGTTDTTPGADDSAAAAAGESRAENPRKMVEYVCITGPPGGHTAAAAAPSSPAAEPSAARTALSYQWACVGKMEGLASRSTRTMYVRLPSSSTPPLMGIGATKKKKRTTKRTREDWGFTITICIITEGFAVSSEKREGGIFGYIKDARK
ncbi:hypothetical protein ACMD2_04205 [Ananas comosus]|uniref:Uncharacterized protein n=1 Tax=Ananas comosus TaxID=4615 RepID=A0A199VT19_ANACO|nr:hypothetical protein ACMD2_04205 [Ananas comosus]